MGKIMKPQYEELAQRVRKGMEWIDSPVRTQAQIDQWFPTFIVLFNQITLIEREIRHERDVRR